MNKFIFSLYIFILSLFLPNWALAQTVKYEYEFASIENDAIQEVIQIVLPKIYQTIDKKIIITPLPAKRAHYEANAGIKDGETLRIYSYGDENTNLIRVPTPYYSFSTAVFSLKSSQVIINDLNDLKQYKVGKVSGIKHLEDITKGFKNLYDSKNVEKVFQQLVLGNIDVALVTLFEGELLLNKAKFSEIQILAPSLVKLDLYHYIHKNHEDLVEPINNAIKQMKVSGELAKIIAQAKKAILK